MKQFERIGVNRLLDAHSIEEANAFFENSCECCCSKGRYSDCRRCAISYSHTLIVAYFNEKNSKGN